MLMGLKILWDHDAPDGIQLPVARTITRILGMPVEISENHVRFSSGYDNARKQYDAQTVLNRLQTFKMRYQIGDPLLLVMNDDLYTSGWDFVFGLARDTTGAAVVSSLRLDSRYYGRDRCDEELVERISKEGAHELGHLKGLSHCTDPECVMFQPRTLDELDRKKTILCISCRRKMTDLAE
jgi:archaemetzincin